MNKKTFTWHFVYWLFPLICTGSVFATLLLGPKAIELWVVSPHGFLENIPSIFLIIAISYCIAILRKPETTKELGIKVWLFVLIFASIYFMGEDENWGQYWFNWNVPEYFMEHNKEHETNLHNMSTWFNQKPRIVMTVWAIVACMLVPFGWKWPKKVTSSFVPPILWPVTRSLSFIVLLAIATDIGEKLDKHFFTTYNLMDTGIRLSEVEEMIFAYLILLYAADLKKRVDVYEAAH